MTRRTPTDSQNEAVARLPRLFSRDWWHAFLPARSGIDSRERLRVVLGALIGILVAGLLGQDRKSVV